ncbi:amidophosphoribosyltransferase [Helicobacter saguini]|uniref:amidophosphoribosyltransferase n=1 Tax=Helicobacter saguini TaxID=1548018 RepID=UPI000A78A9F1|nr:amidophosphoribosyltransferase [Helicobacter saguini]
MKPTKYAFLQLNSQLDSKLEADNFSQPDSKIESKPSEKFKDECAVVGVFNCDDAALSAYYSLFSMQHRGQEASGISACDNGKISTIKSQGLVTKVFTQSNLQKLKGRNAIGHNRYGTAGADSMSDCQPIFARYDLGQISVVHNGNLTNALEIRQKLIDEGAIFQSSLDTEVIIHLIARSKKTSLTERIIEALNEVQGAFCLVFLSRSKMFAVRDRFGLRPLSLATLQNKDGTLGYIVASETCAFDLLGAKFVRDIAPGELLIFERNSPRTQSLRELDSRCVDERLSSISLLESSQPANLAHDARIANHKQDSKEVIESKTNMTKNTESNNKDSIESKLQDSNNLSPTHHPIKNNPTNITSKSIFPTQSHKPCVFEYIYFARPDSVVFNKSVYAVRKNLGKQLAIEHRLDADLVMPVPDSGLAAAIGYAQKSGIDFELGLIRNHYVGRTFIEPTQELRELKVRLKLNPIREIIQGKRVIVIDDSLVRGTTSKAIVKLLKDAGAREVFLLISAPPTISPCFYGVDTPSKAELISANMDIESVRKFVNADYLGYLSLQGLKTAIDKDNYEYCQACFDGKYLHDIPLDSMLSREKKCNGM